MKNTSAEYEALALSLNEASGDRKQAQVFATLAVAAAIKEGPSNSELSPSELRAAIHHLDPR